MPEQQPKNPGIPWLITGLVLGLLAGWTIARATAPNPASDTAKQQAAPAESVAMAPVPAEPAPQTAAPAPESPVQKQPIIIDMRPKVQTQPEPVPEAETLPPAEVDLRLLGTMMGEDEDDRMALIENVARGRQNVYVEGSTLLPGVTLERVEDERIIINRNGTREVLRLARAKRAVEE